MLMIAKNPDLLKQVVQFTKHDYLCIKMYVLLLLSVCLPLSTTTCWCPGSPC